MSLHPSLHPKDRRPPIHSNSNFSFTRSFVHGELHYRLWYFIARGIGFVNSAIVIASLTTYQYGTFQLFLSFSAITAGLLSLDGGVIGNDIMRAVGEKDEVRAKRLFLESFWIRAFIGVVFWAVVFFGINFFDHRYKSDFIQMIRITSFLIPCSVLTMSLKSLLKTRLAFRHVASRSTFGKVVQLLILFGFSIFATITTREVLISVVVSSVAGIVSLLGPAWKAYQPWRGIFLKKGLLLPGIFRSYGKWVFLKEFFVRATEGAQPWLIKIFVSTEAVGIYNIAIALVDFIQSVISMQTLTTLIPRSITNRDQLRRIFVSGVKFFTVVALGLAMLGAVFGTEVVILFFNQHRGALPYFYLLLLLVPLVPLLQFTSAFLVAFRSQKFFFLLTVIRSIVSLLLLFFMLPVIGLWGVALTRIVSDSLTGIWSYLFLVRRHPYVLIRKGDIFSYSADDRFIVDRMLRMGGEWLRSILRFAR